MSVERRLAIATFGYRGGIGGDGDTIIYNGIFEIEISDSLTALIEPIALVAEINAGLAIEINDSTMGVEISNLLVVDLSPNTLEVDICSG